jgi:hypothetical protein
MASNTGYGKISTSGLTFAYDMGDTDISFKGKPTTNLVPDPRNMSGWSSYGEGNDGTFVTEFGTVGYKMHNRGSWNGVYRGISLPSTGTYTLSVYVRYLGGSSNNNGGVIYTSGGGISDTAEGHSKVIGEWRRFSMTRTYSTTSITFYLISYGGTYGGDHSSWEVTMPQVEAGSFATPFVDGTRSVTQSVVDLTAGKTIDVTNTTFSSGGVLSFDATDDFLTLGADYNFKTSGGWTVESVVYYNSVAGGYNNVTSPANFIGSEDINYNSWYWSVLDNKLALWNISPGYWRYGSTTLQSNTWYHVTITCSNDGTRYRFYLNGIPEGGDHVDNLWNASYSGLRIRYVGKGNNANVRLVNGQIPVTKVYDRVLTGAEIARNAQHYVDRYGMVVKDGSTESLAAPSAQYLADIGIKTNGVYWINNGTTTKQTYCEFKNGEGWMLVMNIKSDYFGDTNLTWNDYDNWINAGSDIGNMLSPYGSLGQYRHRDLFRYHPTTKWMIKVHNNGTEFGGGSWAAWTINSTYSGQTFEQIMNIPGAAGGGTQISNTYYAQQGMGTSTYSRGLDYCSIARTLGHLRVNHLLNNNGCRILGSEQTLETDNSDVTRGLGTHYAIAGNALTNTQNEWNAHVSPYVNGSQNYTADRRQFTDNRFPDNSNYNTALYQGAGYNPSLTYGGSPAMIAYYHYGIFIK